MKKRLFKNLIFILVFAMAFNIAFPLPLNAKTAAAESFYGVDFSSGVIKYALSDRLRETPDTFEAVIKINKNTEGEIGNIFSNELKSKTPMLSYSVNS